MARVAEQLADDVYLTSDNPRTEDPAAILADVAAGLAGQPRCVEVDRRTAIAAAVSDAGPSDVVLVAGKGHENYQIVGTVKHPFDDVQECERAMGRRPGGGVSGPIGGCAISRLNAPPFRGRVNC